MPTRFQIGNALQGFGEGYEGRGTQWTNQQRELTKDRKQAFVSDFERANVFMQNGEFDRAISLMSNRGAELAKFGAGTDSTDYGIGLAEIGDAEGFATFANSIYQSGVTEGLVPQKAAPVTTTVAKNAVLLDANGNVIYNNSQDPTPTIRTVSALVDGEEKPTSLNFNPATGVYTRQNRDGSTEDIVNSRITQVAITGGANEVLPISRIDTLTEEYDWLQFQNAELGSMIESIREDQTLAGVSGQIRRAGQVILGATGDLADLLGNSAASNAANSILSVTQKATEDLDISEDQFYSLFNDPKLSEIDLFQNTLAYSLARARVPDGRLLATVIEDAKADSKITGFTSSTDVINKLTSIQEQIGSRIGSLERRIGINENDQSSGSEVIDSLLDKYAPKVP